MIDDRYIVCSTTGYSPTAGRGSRPSTSYFVADRFYCYREVANFPVPNKIGTNTRDQRRRLQAEKECARLNALEAADELMAALDEILADRG